MTAKLSAHERNRTWELVPLPLGGNALCAKWVLKPKIDHASNIRLKARAVAKGNEQRPGLDYEDTFAPVVRWSTVCLVTTLAAALRWSISHMDLVSLSSMVLSRRLISCSSHQALRLERGLEVKNTYADLGSRFMV